ncbi:MAG: DNA polymerase III subunit beta [Bacilli bacterium]|nr:DNA polymerase III subunit beta [Bacilli bacterium]
MKLRIKKDILQEAINKVSKAISTKNLIPVLAGIKFELKKNRLTLTASDNDITIQTTIEGASEEDFLVEEEGNIIVQGKYISDIVRKLPDKYINIEVIDEFKILIYTENSEFNLNGIDEKEYPTINLEESKKKIDINSSIFKDIVNQTAFASSNEETKPVLTGINFNIAGNILECNSTDSYRLARKIITLEKESEDIYNIVIPSHNIVEFIRIMDEDEAAIVELHIFNNKVLFKYKNILFQSRLINGTYPNTANLMPEEATLILTADLNTFYNVIDRASILTSDKEKNIVTLETNDDTLILKSSSIEIGRVEEKMKITKSSSEDIKISFSSRYMMEALKSFSTDTIEIHYVGEIKPILLKSNEDTTLTQLVLPIRTY